MTITNMLTEILLIKQNVVKENYMAEINLYQIQAIVSSNENTIDEIDIE